MACRKLFQLPGCSPVRMAAIRSMSNKCATPAAPPAVVAGDHKAEITHTGQVFEPTDYRNVRFENSVRLVNKNWGINLIAEVPPKECTERVIACDGGGGPLGHPKVYINLDKPGDHSCGYCGLRFVKKDDHHH